MTFLNLFINVGKKLMTFLNFFNVAQTHDFPRPFLCWTTHKSNIFFQKPNTLPYFLLDRWIVEYPKSSLQE